MSTNDKEKYKNMIGKLSTEDLLDKIEDGIMIVDKALSIVFYNTAMGDIDMLDPAKIIGEKFTDIFPEHTYKESTILRTLKEGSEFRNVLQSYTTFTGVTNTVLCSTFPILEGNEIIGALEITKDISSIKNMSEKVLDLQEKLISSKKQNKDRYLDDHYTFNDIIGNSMIIKKLIDKCKKASTSSSSVLIQGETGTGKELFSQSIHSGSIRRHHPFIAINCAAVPHELLEGLLFGTIKGAFTGAIDRPGLFEQANHGTLLLDEINSMDLVLQSKLLRSIQEKSIRRVGGDREIKIDIRVIATTNVDLKKMIQEKKFREDLYYRLSVINITIPPLRDRMEDIDLLLDKFIYDFNIIFERNIGGCTEKVIDMFRAYDWPGNIRELRHTIESSFNMLSARDKTIGIKHLPEHFLNAPKASITISRQGSELIHDETRSDLKWDMANMERKRIIDAINKCNGNITNAAKLLGLKRQTLQYRMKKHGISKEDFETQYRS